MMADGNGDLVEGVWVWRALIVATMINQVCRKGREGDHT